MVKASKFPILVCIPFLIGLFIIYYLDPTHDYPTVDIETTLQTNETIKVTIPYAKKDFSDLASAAFPSMQVYFTTNNEGLLLVNLLVPIVPGLLQAVPDVGLTYEIRNTLNMTQNILVKAIRAPAPDQMGKYKNYWYLILSISQLLVSAVYTSMTTRPTIIMRRTDTQSPSCLAKWFCCCTPCGRMPKTPQQITSEMEMRRIQLAEETRKQAQKIEQAQQKAEEKARQLKEKAENRLKQIRDGTYKPTLWERLFGVKETMVNNTV